MTQGQFFALFPLAASAVYALLLVALVVRTGLRNVHSKWFVAVLAGSIVWSLSLIALPPDIYVHLNAKVLAAVATLLAAATAAYVGWPTERRWLLMGAVPLAAAILLDLVWPYPPWLSDRRGAWQLSFGEFIAISTWATLHIAMLAFLLRDYRHARLPWHANRLLHWAVFVILTAAGEFFVLLPGLWPIGFGQLLRLLAIAGLFRAITSHRLFDVRARLRHSLAFSVVAIVSALPAFIVLTATLWLTDRLDLRLTHFYIAALVVIVVGFLIYQPFRRIVERIVYRYLVGQEFHTSTIISQYSQATARALDVEQLAQVILGTIGDLLHASRGALWLVNPCDEGFEMEIVPGPHHDQYGRKLFAPQSQFIHTLIENHRPLLQYDLDFNPYYSALTAEEREWLVEQGMEVYVPIHDGDRLEGIIALGPKSTTLAYRANELELMQLLAEQTIVALQNARLYSELNRQNERIRSLNTDLRKQYDHLEILDRMKSDFITIASHELRTPLTQIKGYSDILTHLNDMAPLDQEKTREIMLHITRAINRLESLITAMLDASELEVSGMELMKTPVRVEMIIQNAVQPLDPALTERHITMHYENLDAVPPLEADFQRLIQAFGNILGNAIKYTPDHGVITVSATHVPGAGPNEDCVEIIVADSGIGIDPQYHDLIFEKFFRIGNPELHSTGATKFKGGGPGLGLHIAKGVISAHDGTIWVESSGEDEQQMPGSRFHILLPVGERTEFKELDERKEASPLQSAD